MPGRTKMLLGFLAFLLVVTAWVYLGPGGDDGEIVGGAGGAPPSTGGMVPRAATSEEPVVEHIEELRVADLAGDPRDYSPGRNPWRYVEPPPPPPPPPPKPRTPTPEEIERMRQAQAELERRRQEELARQREEEMRPKPPPFTMTYMGNFGPPNRRIAVFTDGQEIVNAREGEVIGGKFIVARIGYESVDIRFVDFPNLPPQRLAVGRAAGR